MLNKILGKKYQGIEVFNIPDKKFSYDIKKISKMDKDDICNEVEQMLKYINILCSKVFH